MNLLPTEPNPFGGRVVHSEELPVDTERFLFLLSNSIRAWRNENVKVVWMRLNLEQAILVPAAVDNGFVYHHADAAGVQLTLTITPGSYIPPFATHYIGAGGVVVTENRELLVVSEAYRTKRHYKLPGGALHPGEHIADAAVREVREETGIETVFRSLICFRHWHGYRHGKSDIYFVCRLDPRSFDINRDPSEISECLWMPVDEYLNHDDVHAFNRSIVRAALHESPGELAPSRIEGYGTRETHEFFMPSSTQR
jgi:8-oxo-dGTP pyrophosphatase MutT (NUDIX family)